MVYGASSADVFTNATDETSVFGSAAAPGVHAPAQPGLI